MSDSAADQNQEADFVNQEKQESKNQSSPKKRTNKIKTGGKDRRLKVRGKNFEDNMHKRAEGIEIPKTKKVSTPL